MPLYFSCSLWLSGNTPRNEFSASESLSAGTPAITLCTVLSNYSKRRESKQKRGVLLCVVYKFLASLSLEYSEFPSYQLPKKEIVTSLFDTFERPFDVVEIE